MSVIYLIGPAGVLTKYVPIDVPGIGPQIPDNSITVAQALVKPDAGFVWGLVANKPELLADHRGVIYSTVTGEPSIHDALGNVPEGFTIDPRPSPLHVWSNGAWLVNSGLAYDYVWKQIKAERDRRKVLGVKVGNLWFHSDDASRIQQLALVIMGANMPAGIQWKSMGEEFALMTPTLAMQIFTATATLDQTLFAKATEHRLAMEASAVPSEYDFSTGWPAFYQE